MRTAPVEVLTQAAIMVDTGAATAAGPATSRKPIAPTYLREDIDSSAEGG
jgi:hypothetical protein